MHTRHYISLAFAKYSFALTRIVVLFCKVFAENASQRCSLSLFQKRERSTWSFSIMIKRTTVDISIRIISDCKWSKRFVRRRGTGRSLNSKKKLGKATRKERWRRWCAAIGRRDCTRSLCGQWRPMGGKLPRRHHCASGLWGRSCGVREIKGSNAQKMCREFC